jgi:hypothetical protein
VLRRAGSQKRPQWEIDNLGCYVPSLIEGNSVWTL